MTRPPRITYPAACVLQAIATGSRYGFDIMDATGLPSGTVYPILRRFEESKLVTSAWEEARAAHADGRPRRRNYQLTEAGVATLAVAWERFNAHRNLFTGRAGVSETP